MKDNSLRDNNRMEMVVNLEEEERQMKRIRTIMAMQVMEYK